MKCSKCGEEYDNSLAFCTNCGEENPSEEQPPAQSQEQSLASPQESQMLKRGGSSFIKFVPGFFVLVIGVFLLVFGLIVSSGATNPLSTKGAMTSDLDSAKSTYDANAVGTESAMQQQVAIGWYTNDLLVILNNATANMTDNMYNATANANKKITLSVYISVALLLVALGGYLMLSKLLEKELSEEELSEEELLEEE